MAHPFQRKFLGYSVTMHRKPRLKVAGESIQRLKGKVREIIRRGRGLRRLIVEEPTPLLLGWSHYFRLAETKIIFEELDQWIRHRLRSIILRQWKRPRTRY